MKYILRPYQKECVDVINTTFQLDLKSQLIQLPTGSGKTVIFWSFLKEKKIPSALIIVPSIQLLYQIYETGLDFFYKDSISRKGGNKNESVKKYHICVVNSLFNEFYLNSIIDKFDYIIIDEAHRSLSKSYMDVLKIAKDNNPDIKLIGLTATPERTDCKSLLKIFDFLSYKKEILDLIEQNYLSDIKSFRIKTNIDLHNLKFHHGDYSTSSLIKFLDNDQRNNLIFNAYNEFAIDKKTLVFCININHSIKIADFFNQKGISAAHIDGSFSEKERRKVLDDFRSGKIKVLTNCQLLTEGFDEPSIEALIIARPTSSKTLYTQMVGRGLRTFKEKEYCILIELADNYHSIINFNVLLDLPALTNGNYENGTTLKELKNQFEEDYKNQQIRTTITEFKNDEIKFEEFSVFGKDFKTQEEEESHIKHILKELEELKINIFPPINIEEGLFLIWKHKKFKEKGWLV